MRVLLIEDDPGDAFLVQELLSEATEPVDVTWVRSLAEATGGLTPDVPCVLLDLGLPDAEGLQALHRVLASAPWAAVLVLTGLDDDRRGVAAVAAGAADYLGKSSIDGPLLNRAIRYALERKRADENQRLLREADLRGEENRRLERGLLPSPIVADPTIGVHTSYRPGRDQALLGGDFYDVVEVDDGTMHVMVGDVCGHGPDEAALGVCLRIAWRSLVLAGLTGPPLMSVLDQVLISERESNEIFATLCTLTIAPDRRTASLVLAGHPAPVMCAPNCTSLPEFPRDTALGIAPDRTWPAVPVELPDAWSLCLYTDGLIEGRVPDQVDRLGSAGLIGLLRRLDAPRVPPQGLGDLVLTEVERLNDGPLADDVALVIVTRTPDVS